MGQSFLKDCFLKRFYRYIVTVIFWQPQLLIFYHKFETFFFFYSLCCVDFFFLLTDTLHQTKRFILWEQFPDTRRRFVYLSKQLYANVITMGMSCHYTKQEEERFSVSGIDMFWWEMWISTQQQKQIDLWRKPNEADKSFTIHNKPCADMNWKATQRGRSHDSKCLIADGLCQSTQVQRSYFLTFCL